MPGPVTTSTPRTGTLRSEHWLEDLRPSVRNTGSKTSVIRKQGCLCTELVPTHSTVQTTVTDGTADMKTMKGFHCVLEV